VGVTEGKCRTLPPYPVAAMNPENTAFEKFYLLPRIRNRQRIHISPGGKWLSRATPLPNLDSFYSIVKSMKRSAPTELAVEER